MNSSVYTLKQFAMLVGKSKNLLHRRLTEKPKRYAVRFARKEGYRWVFDRKLVDSAIANGESIVVRSNSAIAIDNDRALSYLVNESKSCGEDNK